MKKFIVRGSIGIVALILILILLVMVFINSIAKSAITSAGTSTLGVDTSLDSISIGLFSGHSSIDGVSVANPKGFDGDFLDLSEGVLDVNLSSLLGDVIEVRQIALDGLKVQFVQKIGGSNVSRILDNVKGSTSGGSDKPAVDDSDSGSSRKFVIDQLKVTNVKVSVAVEPISSATAPSTVTINQIIVKDIGKKKDGDGEDDPETERDQRIESQEAVAEEECKMTMNEFLESVEEEEWRSEQLSKVPHLSTPGTSTRRRWRTRCRPARSWRRAARTGCGLSQRWRSVEHRRT